MKFILPIILEKSEEYKEWLRSLTEKEQGKLKPEWKTLKRAHFGDSKPLKDGLYELKWTNGWRVISQERVIQILY